jgi:hypothetical protein
MTMDLSWELWGVHNRRKPLLIDHLQIHYTYSFSMILKSPISLQELKFNIPVPYNLHVDRELLNITKQKLALARYPEEQSDFNENNWAQGAKVSRVKHLAEHWQNEYDWDTQEVGNYTDNLAKICINTD